MSNDEYYDDVVDPDLVDGFHPIDEEDDLLNEDDGLDLVKKSTPVLDDGEIDESLLTEIDEEDELADFLEHEDY